MANLGKFKHLYCLLFLFFIIETLHACSMYKVSVDGHTMVGCNHDAWRTTLSIWFETSATDEELSVCFTGSRKVGPSRFVPQSGMNESGLVYSRLTAYHPKQQIDLSEKKQVPNEVDYLSDVLRQCRTIEDVERYISSYDHSVFIDDVFIYIDKSGDYLIVEPYQMIRGNDPTYVLANFCPSLTSNKNARKQERYKNGEDFLRNSSPNTSIEFCRAVSDTMSVCRNRNGDGTLLTSIWDTENGLVNLYFYHDFGKTIQFNLAEEFAKGSHSISIPELFPVNSEFERLVTYRTPFSDNSLRITMALTGGMLLLLSFVYLIRFFFGARSGRWTYTKLFYAVMNVILFGYLIVLTTNINIYYFDAPYQSHHSMLISMSSYIPFIMLLLITPTTYLTYQINRGSSNSIVMKGLMTLNYVIYIVLLYGFTYWGFFDVFH